MLKRDTRAALAAACLQAAGMPACATAPVANSQACDVTPPNAIAPEGEAASELWYEQNGLTTVLWQEGTIVFKPGGAS